MAHYSLGELLRKEAKANTGRGVLIASILSRGALVTTSMALEILANVLANETWPILIFDGFPRETANLKPFEELLFQQNIRLGGFIELQILPSLARERVLKRLRDDDVLEVFECRLALFESTIADLRAWYETANKAYHVSANQELLQVIDDVARVISNALKT